MDMNGTTEIGREKLFGDRRVKRSHFGAENGPTL